VTVTSSLYSWLLFVYPRSHRHEFGEEMTSVFCEARRDLPPALPAKINFYLREFTGLIGGAVEAHLSCLFGPAIPSWRFYMQPQFRFPRSTVVLMCLILAGVVLAIEKAKTVVQMKEGLSAGPPAGWHSLFWVYVFAVALALAAAVWGILFALGRTGVHRLEAVQTGVERR
jgi:hypothetical protein